MVNNISHLQLKLKLKINNFKYKLLLITFEINCVYIIHQTFYDFPKVIFKLKKLRITSIDKTNFYEKKIN